MLTKMQQICCEFFFSYRYRVRQLQHHTTYLFKMESGQNELDKLTELFKAGLILEEEFQRRVKEMGVDTLQNNTPNKESTTTDTRATGFEAADPAQAPKKQVNFIFN